MYRPKSCVDFCGQFWGSRLCFEAFSLRFLRCHDFCVQLHVLRVANVSHRKLSVPLLKTGTIVLREISNKTVLKSGNVCVLGQYAWILAEPDSGVEVPILGADSKAHWSFLQSLVPGKLTCFPFCSQQNAIFPDKCSLRPLVPGATVSPFGASDLPT